MSGRFVKGQSGNPAGRPKARRPHVSAFDIIFDKMLTATQNGVERELTVDEALHLQTYQAALKGSKMAVRTVLKMIEKRELALRKAEPKPERGSNSKAMTVHYDADNANEALLLLGIISFDRTEVGYYEHHPKIETWAAQAALSRPGRRKEGKPRSVDINSIVHRPETLRWPRGERG